MTMQIAGWSVHLFPSLVLFRSGIGDEVQFGLVTVPAVLAMYLVLSTVFAGFLTTRRRKAHRLLIGVCTLTLICTVFRMASYADDGAAFAPIYLLFALLLVLPYLLVLITGSWFVLQSESSLPPALTDYLRFGIWYNLLTFVPVLLPLVLVQVPVVRAQQQLIYIGPLALSICLFLAAASWFGKHSIAWLGLEVPKSTLNPSLGRKFQESTAGIEESGNCTIHLLRPGFRNALAFHSLKRILVGIDLLEYLEPKEFRAVLLHELGHIKDGRYMRQLRHVMYCYPIFFVIFQVLYQCDVFPAPFISIAVFMLVILLISIAAKRVRVRSEYRADAFVRDFDVDFQQYLLSALNAMYELNGVEKDFCSKTNHAHLDPDERQIMLKEGRFTLQRKVFRPFFRNVVIYMVIGVIVGLGFNLGSKYIWPSNTEKWRSLHKAYHDRKHVDKAAARQAIEKALKFSKAKFGMSHHSTYISLNDLTELNLLAKDPQAADKSSSQAVEVGEQLYPKDLRKVRSLLNRAETLERLQQYPPAEEIYSRIYEFQEQHADSAVNRGETLHRLGQLYDRRKSYDMAIACYRKIVKLHQASYEDDRAGELQWAYDVLAGELESSGDRQGALQTYDEGLAYMKSLFGDHHAATIRLVCSQAEFLQSIDMLEASRDSYGLCLKKHQASVDADVEDVVYYQAALAEVCLALGETQQAMEYAQLARTEEERLYGAQAPELSDNLKLIARIYNRQGDAENARKYEALSVGLAAQQE